MNTLVFVIESSCISGVFVQKVQLQSTANCRYSMFFVPFLIEYLVSWRWNERLYIFKFIQLHSCSRIIFKVGDLLWKLNSFRKRNRNLSVWDTLLRPEKARVCSFQCHPGGSTATIFSSRHQVSLLLLINSLHFRDSWSWLEVRTAIYASLTFANNGYCNR